MTVSSEYKLSNPKDSSGIAKVPLSVLPAQVLLEVGLALMEGDRKYGASNYRVVGVRESVYYDACMRHLMAFHEGQDIDPDSGLSHITKAIAGLIVLRDAMLNNLCTDDRPPKVANQNFVQDYNAKAKQLIEKYPNPKERYTELNKEQRLKEYEKEKK